MTIASLIKIKFKFVSFWTKFQIIYWVTVSWGTFFLILKYKPIIIISQWEMRAIKNTL